MCGLTSIGTEQYELIMRWWGSNPQSCISQVLYHAAYCYVNLPDRPCYSNLRRSYHTISSIHLVIPRLRPRISACYTSSFAHLGVSRIHPRIPTSKLSTSPPSGSYFKPLCPNFLFLLDSCKISVQVARCCFSVASWRHQASLLCPTSS